ncbi:arginase family protein [Microbacterium luticocti]|uniref:arginase family protein n=1 Tax=Microbacterium luticocti TaxID=451764 RepID=UPI00040986FD|nr:arginase family protein [Microbacterium luticocti]
MTRFLVVPQWQGSSSARAMQLVDGAQAIAGDLPRAACQTVEVPLEAGESLDSGVHRLSALQHCARVQLTALAELADSGEPVLSVGGDAGVATTAALAATGATTAAPDPGAAVVWFSAHAALHDADTSPTGAFDTMAVRALVDDAVPRPAEHGLDPSRVVLAGVRAIDPIEERVAARLGLSVITADELTPAAVVAAVGDATSVFVHIDLDVLDPSAMVGLSDPEPFGPDVAAVTACIQALRQSARLCGSAITGFSPPTPADAVADLGAILRLVGALA